MLTIEKHWFIFLLTITICGCDATTPQSTNTANPSPVSSSDGIAIQDSLDHKVYWVFNNRRYYIKFPATLRALGVADTIKSEPDSVVNAIPPGEDFPAITSRAIQDSSSGKVYILEAGRRRYVSDIADLESVHLTKSQIQGVSGPDANKIPLGAPIPTTR